jgi:hypothetical protein
MTLFGRASGLACPFRCLKGDGALTFLDREAAD